MNRENFGGFNPLFKRIQVFLGPSFLEQLTAWKHYDRFLQSMRPYWAEIGYLENDVKPEIGPLGFRCSGGVALDYNLRSIGTNLRGKQPVVAIPLRRWAEETRVKPENLSVWISDDNKLYRRYDGKISFSNEGRTMLLDHLNFSCQYLKIHCDFKDDKYTFPEDFKRIIEIYGPPDFS